VPNQWNRSHPCIGPWSSSGGIQVTWSTTKAHLRKEHIVLYVWQNHLRNKGFVSQDHIGRFSTKPEYSNTSHEAYNTIDMKLKWSYYILMPCIRVYKWWSSKRLLQRITQSFGEVFISHSKHTLFTLEESGPPRMTYTCES
jgi:hypothetical protein